MEFSGTSSRPDSAVDKWVEVASESIFAPFHAAETAARIYVDRPHIINRRLAGLEEITTFYSVRDVFERASTERNENWLSVLSKYLKEGSSISATENPCTVEVRELIPRSHEYFIAWEAVVSGNDQVTFLPLPPSIRTFHPHEEETSISLNPPVNSNHVSHPAGDKNPTANCAYRISWQTDDSPEFNDSNLPRTTIRLSILQSTSQHDNSDKSVVWLREKLLPKLISWSSKADPTCSASVAQKSSLALVSVKRYTDILLRLKEKYGQTLIQNWTESTDPLKFVSEDLCIAAYLLTLWDVDQCSTSTKPSFADLGCGNGLLVYILSSEGCPGIGIDVRERKIWKQFRPKADLLERTLDPSTETFPDVDWLIGNHSDELTPWIPYIAAMSSYKCNFFLLPCCAFDFNHKFIKPGNESEYSSYFKYIRRICDIFGFVVEEDTLRIPSTKRSCFIGRVREYSKDQHPARTTTSENFVQSRLRTGGNAFVVRAAGSEPVKNCTGLPAELKGKIIAVLVSKLLETDNTLDLPLKKWNAGQKMSLAELAAALDSDTLTALKRQCGGLQTFVRNHKFIFAVQDAEVQLRNYTVPQPSSQRSKKKSNIAVNLKSKNCWFHDRHPDGCPVLEVDCDYSHTNLMIR